MSRPNLAYGDKGKYVEELQTILNETLKKEDRLYYSDDIKVNGNFDHHTKEFVKDYQLAAYLKKNGKVGSKTWAALLGTETYNCFDIPNPQVAAPNKYQCWAGATAMLLKQGSPNTTQPSGVSFEQLGGGAIGGLENSHANMKLFAAHHGLMMQESQSFSCTEMCRLVYNNGRLMLDIKGIGSDLLRDKNGSHFLILAGMRGDGTAGGTTVTLVNPSNGLKAIIVDTFQNLKNKYSQLTYQSFYLLNNYSQPIY